jgi:hypothetical protein
MVVEVGFGLMRFGRGDVGVGVDMVLCAGFCGRGWGKERGRLEWNARGDAMRVFAHAE